MSIALRLMQRVGRGGVVQAQLPALPISEAYKRACTEWARRIYDSNGRLYIEREVIGEPIDDSTRLALCMCVAYHQAGESLVLGDE